MSFYHMDEFIKEAGRMGITVTENQKKQFITYYENLIEWNQIMNLTAITDFEEVLEKHFLDSLSIVKILDLSKKENLIDVGTGAGFPGLPLKIIFPKLKVTLLDSLNKRIEFLNHLIKKMDLKNVECIHGRAEDFAKNSFYREQYDLAVSRAVANLSTLSEYCIPFVKKGGIFVSYKAEKAEEEIEEGKNAISLLGGKIKKCEIFSLGNNIRKMILIEKEESTSMKYPRKAGLPSKKPL